MEEYGITRGYLVCRIHTKIERDGIEILPWQMLTDLISPYT
jgi:polyhydroxyalkanoate synthesis regulator protein